MASIAFQFDEHVPHAVAVALRRRGIDVVTATDTGLRGSSDSEQLSHAAAQGRVMVTHDSDFLALHEQGHRHAGIAYCHQGARTIGELITGLVLVYEVLDRDEMRGRVEFL